MFSAQLSERRKKFNSGNRPLIHALDSLLGQADVMSHCGDVSIWMILGVFDAITIRPFSFCFAGKISVNFKVYFIILIFNELTNSQDLLDNGG